MSKYFVWVKGLRGPEPQIWDDKDKTQEGKPIIVLFKHELLPSEDGLSLSSLALMYEAHKHG